MDATKEAIFYIQQSIESHINSQRLLPYNLGLHSLKSDWVSIVIRGGQELWSPNMKLPPIENGFQKKHFSPVKSHLVHYSLLSIGPMPNCR